MGRRFPGWGRWMLAGFVGGGLVTAVIGPVAWVLVEMTTSPLSQSTFEWSGVSLGVFGCVGGLFVGCCCAAVTGLLASDPEAATARGYAGVAALMTSIVALPLSALAVLPLWMPTSLNGAIVVIALLETLVALPAAVLGAFVYVWSHGPPERVRRWAFGLAGGLVSGAVLVAGFLALGSLWAPTPHEATGCPPFGDTDMAGLERRAGEITSELGGVATSSVCGSVTVVLDRKLSPADLYAELVRLGLADDECRPTGPIGLSCTTGDPPVEVILWGDGGHLSVDDPDEYAD